MAKTIALLERNQVDLVSLADEGYPYLLRNISDPPPLLFIKGKLLANNFKIAVVGTRKASGYGREVATSLGHSLSQRGITVVSGMARGIDGYAQQAALGKPGGSIGVLGNGIGYIYPRSNYRLYERIVKEGTLVSEYLPLTRPKKQNFVYRNRIISGLSQGVVIVESREKGGALITANFALQQGREVFAVPGSIHSETSRGTNDLIQKGARLVTGIDSIMDEFNYLGKN